MKVGNNERAGRAGDDLLELDALSNAEKKSRGWVGKEERNKGGRSRESEVRQGSAGSWRNGAYQMEGEAQFQPNVEVFDRVLAEPADSRFSKSLNGQKQENVGMPIQLTADIFQGSRWSHQ